MQPSSLAMSSPRSFKVRPAAHASASRAPENRRHQLSPAGSVSARPHCTCTDPHHRSHCRPRASSRMRTRRTCGRTTRQTRRSRGSLHGRACALKVSSHCDSIINIVLFCAQVLMHVTVVQRTCSTSQRWHRGCKSCEARTPPLARRNVQIQSRYPTSRLAPPLEKGRTGHF